MPRDQSRRPAARRQRRAEIERSTKETDIALQINVDGTGRASVDTGVPFLNHMLDSFARHGFFDLEVRARGDLDVDLHHTVEDVGLVLGEALRQALGDKAGIRRFGEASCPLDEALAPRHGRPERPPVPGLRSDHRAGSRSGASTRSWCTTSCSP